MPVNPLLSAVVAGGIAGGVELIIMYPLDVRCRISRFFSAHHQRSAPDGLRRTIQRASSYLPGSGIPGDEL
eukprot:COSAG04_NODE_5836_length_1479_cov_0.907246_2_plen_71_part_00